MSEDIDDVWISCNIYDDYNTKGIESTNPLLILTKRVLEVFDKYAGLCSFKTVIEDLPVKRSQLYDIFQVLVGAEIIENISLGNKSFFKLKKLVRLPSKLHKVHKQVQTEYDSSISNVAKNKLEAGSSMKTERTKQHSTIGSATTIDAKCFDVSMDASDNMIEVMSDGSIQLRTERIPNVETKNVRMSTASTNKVDRTTFLTPAYVMLPSEGSLKFPTYFKAIPMPANFMASQTLRNSQTETPSNAVSTNISKTNKIKNNSEGPIACEKQDSTYTKYGDTDLSFLPIPQLPAPSSVKLNQKTDVQTMPMKIQKLTIPTFTPAQNTSTTSVVKSKPTPTTAAPCGGDANAVVRAMPMQTQKLNIQYITVPTFTPAPITWTTSVVESQLAATTAAPLPIPQLPVPSVTLNQKNGVQTMPMQIQKLTVPTFTPAQNTSTTSVVKSKPTATTAAPLPIRRSVKLNKKTGVQTMPMKIQKLTIPTFTLAQNTSTTSVVTSKPAATTAAPCGGDANAVVRAMPMQTQNLNIQYITVPTFTPAPITWTTSVVESRPAAIIATTAVPLSIPQLSVPWSLQTTPMQIQNLTIPTFTLAPNTWTTSVVESKPPATTAAPLPIPQLPAPSSVKLNQKTGVQTMPMKIQKLTIPTFTLAQNTSTTSVVTSKPAATTAAPSGGDAYTEQEVRDVWDFEPFSDDENEETIETNDTDSSSTEGEDLYQNGNTKKYGKKTHKKVLSQIFFKRTDPEITMDFLEMFKSRPVLHCSSGMPDNIYDKAITQITTKLNEKWGSCYTYDSIRKSVKRIRNWYYMVSYKRSQMDIPENCLYRHYKYFDKLAEFLPEKGLGIPCDQCHRRMFDAASMQAHKARAHNHDNLPFKCSSCHLCFATRNIRSMHEKVHTAKYKCEICNKQFISKGSLYAHNKMHSGNIVDPSCICDVCGRKFARPQYCNSHKRCHYEPQYKCETCGKTYFRVTLLKYHMKTHRNQRDYVCEICGSAFYRKLSLQEHQIGKHESGFICNICKMKFSSTICLRNHQRRYHFVYEGTIEDLEKITSTGYKRYCIYEENTKKRMYVCDVCGNSYYAVSGYHLHRAKVHGITPAPHPIRSKFTNKKKSNACKKDDDLQNN